jgi:hypothetical protein
LVRTTIVPREVYSVSRQTGFLGEEAPVTPAARRAEPESDSESESEPESQSESEPESEPEPEPKAVAKPPAVKRPVPKLPAPGPVKKASPAPPEKPFKHSKTIAHMPPPPQSVDPASSE